MCCWVVFFLFLSSLSSSFFFSFSTLSPSVRAHRRRKRTGKGSQKERPAGTSASQPFILKSKERAVQRLTGLRRQQARLPFDYLDPETGWKANRETEGRWGKVVPEGMPELPSYVERDYH